MSESKNNVPNVQINGTIPVPIHDEIIGSVVDALEELATRLPGGHWSKIDRVEITCVLNAEVSENFQGANHG